MFDIEQQKQKYLLLYSVFIAQNKDKTVKELFPKSNRHEKVKIGEFSIDQYQFANQFITKLKYQGIGLCFTSISKKNKPYSQLYNGVGFNLFDYISFEDKI